MGTDLRLLALEIRNRTAPDFGLLARWREWIGAWVRNCELERERGEVEREIADLQTAVDPDAIAAGWAEQVSGMFKQARPDPADLAQRLAMCGDLSPTRLAGDRPLLILAMFAAVANGAKVDPIIRKASDAIADALRSKNRLGIIGSRPIMRTVDRDAKIANARARLASITAEIEESHKSRPERWGGGRVGDYSKDRWTLAVSDWLHFQADYNVPVGPPDSDFEGAVVLRSRGDVSLWRQAGLDRVMPFRSKRTAYIRNGRGEYVDADLCAADKPGEVCNVVNA